MSYNGQWAGSSSSQYASAYAPEAREPGARRKKLAGYLRAANELRQTYSESYRQAWSSRGGDGDETNDMPGAFPGASMTNNGDEQLVIFPSYARRHIKRSEVNRRASSGYGSSQDDASDGAGDQDFWQRQWDKHEDDNAIVDVDVRGWIYVPHRGPPTRKHRLLVGLARQLSGIPAPRQSPSESLASSRAPSPARLSDRLEAHKTKHEEELAKKEARSIVRRGEAEAQAAGEGVYSENPVDGHHAWSPANSTGGSRAASPDRSTIDVLRGRQQSLADDTAIKPPQRQGTWTNTSDMSEAELVMANKHLLSRLQPFLANPLCNVPISAFFYNDQVSRQKSVETDASGHFTLRAALDFVPTHVRILASERLSTTQEVVITEPNGVSVISDIDDTIKHSAIGSGAKEIFKNVFVRELGELSIKGVKDWYSRLSKMGCFFHYVSNSPWQLYPLLTSYFAAAGLPPGSFHLKQYSGMLQGIFEPVAERKKGTLERILIDFPERRFLLVGDSGEADLEVYTDVVLENPGRILGIFIRDVTTSTKQQFFDPAQGPLSANKSPKLRPDGLRHSKSFPKPDETDRNGRHDDEDPYMKEAIRRSLADQEQVGARPALPPRRPTAPAAPEENLIDLDFDDTSVKPKKDATQSSLSEDWLKPPPRPVKPRNLSSQTLPRQKENSPDKVAPPRPRKPSTSIHVSPGAETTPEEPFNLEGLNDKLPEKMPRPEPPPPRRPLNGSQTNSPRNAFDATDEVRSESRPVVERRGPPPTPRRKPVLSSSGPSRSATVPLSSGNSVGDSADTPSSTASYSSYWGSSQDPQVSKKEEAWMRRWAKAKDIMDRKGVMLRSWRVGEDVQRDAIALVERAVRQDRRRY